MKDETFNTISFVIYQIFKLLAMVSFFACMVVVDLQAGLALNASDIKWAAIPVMVFNAVVTVFIWRAALAEMNKFYFNLTCKEEEEESDDKNV